MTLPKKPGAPSFKRETAKTAIRKRWPSGIPNHFSNVDVFAQVRADLKQIGCQEISTSTLDQARNDIDAERRG
jgi:hypothetical protein